MMMKSRCFSTAAIFVVVVVCCYSCWYRYCFCCCCCYSCWYRCCCCCYYCCCCPHLQFSNIFMAIWWRQLYKNYIIRHVLPELYSILTKNANQHNEGSRHTHIRHNRIINIFIYPILRMLRKPKDRKLTASCVNMASGNIIWHNRIRKTNCLHSVKLDLTDVNIEYCSRCYACDVCV